MCETTVMWTRQVPQVWEELQRTGSYHVRKEYIQMKNGDMSDFYLKLYEWYTKEAGKYINIPSELEYPIWLCLEEENMLQPVQDTVILKVELPKDSYVICNMDNWGYRVNYWYVPLDPEDEERHKQELKKYGIACEDDLTLTSKGNFYPLLRRKIQDSWERVFTVSPSRPQDAVATAWEIRREWVKEVRCYGGE